MILASHIGFPKGTNHWTCLYKFWSHWHLHYHSNLVSRLTCQLCMDLMSWMLQMDPRSESWWNSSPRSPIVGDSGAGDDLNQVLCSLWQPKAPSEKFTKSRIVLLAGSGYPQPHASKGLQLFPMMEEFPISMGHQLILHKSLPLYTLSIITRKPLDWPPQERRSNLT